MKKTIDIVMSTTIGMLTVLVICIILGYLWVTFNSYYSSRLEDEGLWEVKQVDDAIHTSRTIKDKDGYDGCHELHLRNSGSQVTGDYFLYIEDNEEDPVIYDFDQCDKEDAKFTYSPFDIGEEWEGTYSWEIKFLQNGNSKVVDKGTTTITTR